MENTIKWALPSLRQLNNAPLTHLSPPEPGNAYYRSKIITVTTGVNPLVTAATALFVALIQLHHQTVDVHKLYQELVHEIKSFETRAQQESYTTESILIARYLLCATLDEALLHGKYKLLGYFHNEERGDERFFVIVERLCNEPAVHCDLLELAYLCLNQGFIGKYRHEENGRAELNKLMERIYRCIYQQHITANTLPPPSLTPPYQEENPSAPPIWPMVAFTGLLLLTIYTGFTFMLESSVAPLYQQLNSVSQQYVES